jgi:hypothetical protein
MVELAANKTCCTDEQRNSMTEFCCKVCGQPLTL